MILIDSSVLIDLIEQKPNWFAICAKLLYECAQRDSLGINIIIYSEISRSFATSSALDEFLKSTSIRLENIPSQAAFDAARAHDQYRAVGGLRTATLPDFFIGAHAKTSKMQLLTRDPKRIRTYFPTVELIVPQ